jgi:hypothetical protein
MEKRSRRRTRDLVTQPASQGLSQNEIGCVRISMMAKSMNALFTGRIQKRKTNPLYHSHLACNARPVHTDGSSRSFKRKPRTSASPPDSGHIAASYRSATKSADARRGAAHGGELRQAAGAAAWAAADKRRRAIRLRSACRPHGAEEAKRPQISGVYHWAGAARLRRARSPHRAPIVAHGDAPAMPWR